jgi:hypothetical protein
MNFIEAIQALQNQKCKQIQRKASPSNTCLGGADGYYWCGTNNILADDWELVNPTPQVETVVEKRRICPKCEDIYDGGGTCCCGVHLVDCTITYPRPKKRKVVKRVGLGRASFSHHEKLISWDISNENRPDEIKGQKGAVYFEYEVEE